MKHLKTYSRDTKLKFFCKIKFIPAKWTFLHNPWISSQMFPPPCNLLGIRKMFSEVPGRSNISQREILESILGEEIPLVTSDDTMDRVLGVPGQLLDNERPFRFLTTIRGRPVLLVCFNIVHDTDDLAEVTKLRDRAALARDPVSSSPSLHETTWRRHRRRRLSAVTGISRDHRAYNLARYLFIYFEIRILRLLRHSLPRHLVSLAKTENECCAVNTRWDVEHRVKHSRPRGLRGETKRCCADAHVMNFTRASNHGDLIGTQRRGKRGNLCF